MLKESMQYYYKENDYNCAESIIRACNDVYQLGLSEDSLKLMSGYGGGMSCGKTCGAVLSALAVISRCTVEQRAHTSEGFMDKCEKLVKALELALGTIDCTILKETNYKEDTHCLITVDTVADVVENYMTDLSA